MYHNMKQFSVSCYVIILWLYCKWITVIDWCLYNYKSWKFTWPHFWVPMYPAFVSNPQTHGFTP